MITSTKINGAVTITVDFSGLERLQEKLDLLSQVIPQTVKEAGDYAQGVWVKNAQESVKSSQNYVDAVIKGSSYPANGSQYQYTIFPDYVKKGKNGQVDIIKILEEGYPAYDMKDGLLKGKNSKVVKFDYDTPMKKDARYEMAKSANALPVRIFQLLEQGHDFTGHVMGARGDLNPAKLKHFSVLSPGNNFPKHSSAGNPITMKYQWKTRQFKGLHMSGKNKASLYRTVSKDSPSDSWINPGQPAKNIFANTMDSVVPTINDMFEKAVQNIVNK